ncbi:secondary thiamine-phosphate synthase enzyme YjbQ [Marinobacterium ramblicola]|uniref:secondary thiamine-phosphate synthase enzyme YjbQ n=1 Tax=Marinobacterium ramblicola TaxID=2849041 RepID=UPI003CCE8BA9
MNQPLWVQRSIRLKPRGRGFHLITDEIEHALPELEQLECGLLHLFLQHTSAALTLTENADPTVRQDLESHFNRSVPEREGMYRHDYEGLDDMPAHIKSSLLGVDLMLPVTNGALNLGIWQGICFCEHRDGAGGRQIVATLQGCKRSAV